MSRCLQVALPGVEVRPHDDGSRPNRHDFDLVRDRNRYAALEVTAAADAESITLWKSMTRGGRWIEEGLAGGWVVELLPTTRMKTVRIELPQVLARMEQLGIRTLRDAHGDVQNHLVSQAEGMGVATAWQSHLQSATSSRRSPTRPRATRTACAEPLPHSSLRGPPTGTFLECGWSSPRWLWNGPSCSSPRRREHPCLRGRFAPRRITHQSIAVVRPGGWALPRWASSGCGRLACARRRRVRRGSVGRCA
ncbi:hypothetical protein QF027_004435 [Streptomyces canus]|nr:hypothetical protein [Streptomyces canus]